MAEIKIFTTNYYNSFIEVADDTKAIASKIPISKNVSKTIAEMQYEILINHPYKYTSDEILFQIFASRNKIAISEYDDARNQFFSKGQPCLRTSPLAKTYGFGIHFDIDGKVAIYGMETEEYQQFLNDPKIKKIKSLNSRKK